MYNDGMEKMNPEQMELFISAAQSGVCCGLQNPIEWYMNIVIHAMNLYSYEDIPEMERKLTEAFTAFYKGAASCPEEENLTTDGFIEMVNKYYDKGNSEFTS